MPAVELEKHLDSAPAWGPVLEQLYSLGEKDVASQYALLIRADHAMILVFSRTEDRHRRPSIVLIVGRITVDWTSDHLAEKIGRTAALTSRLALEYAEAFRRNPDRVQAQLRESRFMLDRRFSLDGESPTAGNSWSDIVAAIKEWQGINGVATARLIPVGANIVIGTRHEALAAQTRADVDGFFDVRERKIAPLSARIAPWPRPIAVLPNLSSEIAPESAAPPTVVAPEELKSIDRSLKRIDHSVDRMASAVAELCRLIIREWLSDDRGPKR